MQLKSSDNSRARVDQLAAARTARPQGDGLRLEDRVAALRERLEARADERTSKQLNDDVREARGHVRGWSPERAVSADTAARYAKAVEQMRSAGERPEDADCRNTFEFRRAALVHEARKEIRGALRDLDKARRGGNVDQSAGAYNRLRSGLATLREYPPSTGSRELDLQRESAYSGPSHASLERSNGKRPSLRDLPADWRDRVQQHVSEQDRPAVAVMALTGCRPAEVRGVRVEQTGAHVTFTIKGAKYDDARGVKTRSISIEKTQLEQSQAGRDLQEWLGGREVRTVAVGGSVEAFRERVGRAADRAGLEQVSGYTYRHQEACDLKNAGLAKEEIAARLGHRSERSQSVYG